MALLKLVFDKLGIERKDFDYIFSVDDSFYVAVMTKTNAIHLRTSPFARSSLLIKGPKYTKSVNIARQVLFEQQTGGTINLYTAYSPKDRSYFVSGFETQINTEEPNEQAERKLTVLKLVWENTLQRMTQAGIEIWSK